MNIKKKYRLLVLFSTLAHIAAAESPPGILLDGVIANVDSHIILQSELETAYQQYLLQGGKESPHQKCEILKQLIINKALLSKAMQEGIVLEQEVVEELLSDRMRYFLAQVGSEEELVQYWGKPIVAIKSEMRERIKEQLTLDKMRTKIVRDVSVTPKEVREFFEALPFQERPYYPAEVSIRQIVQYPQGDQQEKDTQLAQLNALKVRIQDGEDFEVLARAYSQDPSSASLGGDLGFWHLGELAPAYEETALALQPGEVSDPVITPLGVHLIQLIAREKDRYSSRHILLKPSIEPLDTEAVKIQLARLRTAILAGNVTFEQAARKFSEDSTSAANGGLLTGEHGSTRMLIDALSPDLYFDVEQLVPGAISDPMLFTAADGREAVRLLLLEEKIAPHQANLAQDYAKIQQMLIDQRKVTALQQWVERVKAGASIHVAPEYQHCKLLGEVSTSY
jgi:peptidyl-prolyl cis-trans isomerase SurA